MLHRSSMKAVEVWFAMARNVFTTFGVACISTSWGCERRVYIHATRDRSTALVIPYHYIPIRIVDSRVTGDPRTLLASFLLGTSLLVLVTLASPYGTSVHARPRGRADNNNNNRDNNVYI